MSPPPERRSHVTLSPRARRVVISILIVSAVVVPLSYVVGKANADDGQAVIGAELHALYADEGRVFMSGHEGAAVSEAGRGWTTVPDMTGRDGMAWASTDDTLLVAGHHDLYVSRDGGLTFAPTESTLRGKDVHALGARGTRVIASTPQGLFVSADDGQTFRALDGGDPRLVGAIFVDQGDAGHLLGADTALGAVESNDGGGSWQRIGGPSGAESLAVDPTNPRRMTVVGQTLTAETTDGGGTWRPLDVPAGTRTATYNAVGDLVVAALQGSGPRVYVRTSGSWRDLT